MPACWQTGNPVIGPDNGREAYLQQVGKQKKVQSVDCSTQIKNISSGCSVARYRACFGSRRS